ncbi:hypothetical protein ES288_D01G203000v1 [Gossypium darwinii]|uniref:Dirigent protein n=1 Tax=Gossypium darwinii TaxID=34276 RepID=A0A5D2DRX9_GOSDA|nr:hypothetical protein ES288_D01G203000v1 [Gossypium darwinii]
MRRTLILTTILILYLFIVSVQSKYHSRSLPYDSEKAKTISGSNPTVAMIAQANITNNNNNSSVPFSTVLALDDILKIGPETNSEVIGNAQGLGVLIAETSTTNLLWYWDFGFITGKFNGSSISMFSRNPTTAMVHELSVVGGRGKFRMAKGYAQIQYYIQNDTNIISKLNVTVIHY